MQYIRRIDFINSCCDTAELTAEDELAPSSTLGILLPRGIFSDELRLWRHQTKKDWVTHGKTMGHKDKR